MTATWWSRTTANSVTLMAATGQSCSDLRNSAYELETTQKCTAVVRDCLQIFCVSVLHNSFVGKQIQLAHVRSQESLVCSSEQQNSTCDSMCGEEGCWGPGPSMCVSCQHVMRRERCVSHCNLLDGLVSNI